MTPNPELLPLPTPEEIARAAATVWLGLLMRRTDRRVPFGVALSGGRIASTFYKEVVKLGADRRAEFEGVHFFWADERCVPPSDPENNYEVASKHLFQPFSIPAENVHRIHGEVPGDYAVREAEAELCRLMPLSPEGQPVLDLVILGMGEDGHIASLFPEESIALVEDRRVFRRVTATKPPPERITLGYQPLFHAREVLVLASGRGKAEALKRAREGDLALPMARVIACRKRTTIYFET